MSKSTEKRKRLQNNRNDTRSEGVSTKDGISEGGWLSLLLFNVFVDNRI